MTSRSVLLIVILCGFWLSAVPVEAQAYAPIFDKRYIRASGTPVSTSDTFAACDPSGAFRLVVINGPGSQDEIATDPLSSGSVSVNGVEVVKESDLKQSVTRVERALTGIGSANRLDVSLRSGPAGAIQVIVEANQACGFRITSPATGTVLYPGTVLVRGTLPAQSGVDVGVAVNDAPAVVDATHFAALVRVGPGVTALTAELNTFAGTQARDSVAVSVAATGEDAIVLRTSRPGGAAPLSVEFRLSRTIRAAQVVLDADGDGVSDYQGAPFNRFTYTYAKPGLYVPIARVTDAQGTTHTAMTVIHVMDPGTIDLRLQAVWTAFKNALRAGDVAGAAKFLHSSARADYEAQLGRFSPTALANIDQQMTTLRLVEVGFGGAEYEMLRLRGGATRSFAVWFNLDHDGMWRLRRF